MDTLSLTTAQDIYELLTNENPPSFEEFKQRYCPDFSIYLNKMLIIYHKVNGEYVDCVELIDKTHFDVITETDEKLDFDDFDAYVKIDKVDCDWETDPEIIHYKLLENPNQVTVMEDAFDQWMSNLDNLILESYLRKFAGYLDPEIAASTSYQYICNFLDNYHTFYTTLLNASTISCVTRYFNRVLKETENNDSLPSDFFCNNVPYFLCLFISNYKRRTFTPSEFPYNDRLILLNFIEKHCSFIDILVNNLMC